jgi:hypothetical protein
MRKRKGVVALKGGGTLFLYPPPFLFSVESVAK